MKVLVPLGTRPEIIKLAPVVAAMRAHGIATDVVATGQHYDADLTDAFFNDLGLHPDERWTLDGSAAHRVGSILEQAVDLLGARRPDAVVLLGDTNTVPLFCLAARRFSIPIVHVEAGLRSHNSTSLEEANRRVAGALASLHFAPTALAAEFLTREGVADERIRVVGNPIIDVLHASGKHAQPLDRRSGVVMTAHRASNVDDPDRLEQLVTLARRCAEEIGPVVFPLHPRTRARLEAAGSMMVLDRAGVTLLPPVSWDRMLDLVAGSRVVVTDSGGLQEEAAFFGVPVVVLRTSTPRWEGVEAGTSVLTGLDADRATAAARSLAEPGAEARIAAVQCPYGDGRVSERIAVLADPATASLLAITEPDLPFAADLAHAAGRLVNEPRVVGVLVDLDDTLFPQSAWLAGAWRAVATAAGAALDANAFEAALVTVASEGSDRGRIIDRALAALGGDAATRGQVPELVAAFRAHRAAQLECYAGARAALAALRTRVPVALITDGDPNIQRGKIAALGLDDAFDAIVCSDDLGRAFRKPSPAPFSAALELLGLPASGCVMIGDRPDKDIAGARAAGLVGAVRVRTGEYHATETDDALAVVDDFAEAVAWLQPVLGQSNRASGAAPDPERQHEQRGRQADPPRVVVSR